MIHIYLSVDLDKTELLPVYNKINNVPIGINIDINTISHSNLARNLGVIFSLICLWINILHLL